ncbi:MAG: DinB family protein [Bryobacteraceae bacterium]
MIESLLPEFDHEMANTRKTLERIPDGQLAWKPHEKSMAMGDLATHLAQIPAWTVFTIKQDNFDTAPEGAERPRLSPANSRAEALALFDKNLAEARDALAGAADDHLLKPWSLLAGGKTLFTLPRIAIIRSWVMNHSIHHRAQLGVYLRLNDVPVPAIYGPSADEGGM